MFEFAARRRQTCTTSSGVDKDSDSEPESNPYTYVRSWVNGVHPYTGRYAVVVFHSDHEQGVWTVSSFWEPIARLKSPLVSSKYSTGRAVVFVQLSNKVPQSDVDFRGAIRMQNSSLQICSIFLKRGSPIDDLRSPTFMSSVADCCRWCPVRGAASRASSSGSGLKMYVQPYETCLVTPPPDSPLLSPVSLATSGFLEYTPGTYS
jgi:hypothetical protein